MEYQTEKLDDSISLIKADLDSIQTLACEVNETVEPNGLEARKLNAICTIAECIDRRLTELGY